MMLLPAHLFKGKFSTQVASSHHSTINSVQNVVEILNCISAFDFRKHTNAGASLGQIALQLIDAISVLRGT